jgi:putative heme-binding domain-containing protein
VLASGLTGASLKAEDPSSVAVEAVRRLKGADLSANPALKSAVDRVVQQVRGQAVMVELIRDFDLKERVPDLLEFLKKHPEDNAAAEAVQYVAKVDARRLDSLIQESDASADLLDAIGKSGVGEWSDRLASVVGAADRKPTQREAGVRALLATETGAKALLKLVQGGGLPAPLREIAVQGLRGARWPSVRAVSAELGSERSQSPPGVPSKEGLLRIAGDVARGSQVFRRGSASCLTCHQVGREGVDFGPRLTEIGGKLGKEALYDAIVDPSAGISFGFEAWLLTLRDGDEVLGLISSETEQEILMKMRGGQSLRFRKADVIRREKQLQSIMPTGLHEGLSAQDFADLLAYLASLKPTAP